MSESTIRLREIAHARSGDKGNHANIGVIAFTSAGHKFIGDYLTEARVAAYFENLQPAKTERFELPGIQAHNFLLHQVLDGGGSRSLRIDSQGKTLGLALLEMEIPTPDGFNEMVPRKD